FCFKQKTAYEIQGDWSSDVCSSDLLDDRRSLLVGECEGGHPPGHLSLYTEGLPAGGEKAQRRTGIEQAVDEFRAGRHQVLAVIRSEERRVGKECRARGGRSPEKKQQ